MNKLYVDTIFGQVHCRHTSAGKQTKNQSILCLHPMPFSGLFYDTITPFLAKNYNIISPDYPGYGASDRPEDELSIELWADSMASTLDSLEINQPCHVLGFHSGCLVATELSLRYPELVEHLLLVDIPYLSQTERAEMLSQTSTPPSFSEDVDCIASSWKMNVGSKLGKISINRALENMAEHLRIGEHANLGFKAAFQYDVERITEIKHRSLIVATGGNMHDPCILSAAKISESTLRERKDIKAPAFEIHASELADEILEYLDKTVAV